MSNYRMVETSKGWVVQELVKKSYNRQDWKGVQAAFTLFGWPTRVKYLWVSAEYQMQYCVLSKVRAERLMDFLKYERVGEFDYRALKG